MGKDVAWGGPNLAPSSDRHSIARRSGRSTPSENTGGDPIGAATSTAGPERPRAGATVDAALLSQNVTASGDTSSSQVGFTTGTAAAAASQSLSSDEQTKAGAPKETKEADEPKRTLAAAPKLTRTVGRVTVILPNTP